MRTLDATRIGNGCWSGFCASVGLRGLWALPAAAHLFDLARKFMAISGVFIGLTEAELLAIKAKALAEITSGVVMTNYSDSGSSIGKAIVLPAKDRLTESMYALQLLLPATYGNPQARVIRCDWSNYRD